MSGKYNATAAQDRAVRISKPHRFNSDRVFDIVNYVLSGLLFLIVIYPLIFVVSASFSSPEALIAGKVWFWPVDVGLEGYKAVFEYSKVWFGYLNSIFYAVFGSAISLFMTIIAAYPLSRKDFYGRNVLMFLFTFTMLFNAGLIPTFLVVRDLGIINTRWALLLPGAISVYNLIITMNYFRSNIPGELLEAAQIDGCNDFKFLARIVLPLSMPIIAIIALYSIVGQWNAYFDAMIYLKDAKMFPLQLVLREILILNKSDELLNMNLASDSARQNLEELLKYALIVVSTVPLLIVYPFVQRFFIQGIMVGSIKG